MIKRFISISICITALLALPMLYGCGSGTKEGETQVTVAEAVLAGVAACTNCHAIQTNDWKDGAHTNKNDNPSYAMIGKVGESSCRECHDPNNEGSSLNEVLGGTFNARPVNGCETCHGNGGNHFGLGPIAKYRVAASTFAGSQFMTCNACHRLLDKTTGALMPAGQHATDNIQMNHVATPGSWTGTGGVNVKDITGVSLDPKNNHACSNCHNPHKADLTINKDWYKSAHAAKDAAGAWAHYNWSNDDRKACQRCHTTSGFATFATKNEASQGSYVAATDAPLKADPNWKPEMISCIGCHTTNYDGGRRNPKAIIADYNFNGAKAAFPDAGDSNICISCHAGRESGESLNSVKDFTNNGFVNSHYLAAAGLMYMKSGFTAFTAPTTKAAATYTYGDSYTMYYGSGTTPAGNISSTHRKLGTSLIVGDSHNPAVFTTGNFDSMGPCVTCHMQGAGQAKRKTSHTWAIDLNAAKDVCINCHAGEVDTAALLTTFLEENSAVFQNALTLALNTLQTKYNIKYDGAYPYFYDLAKDATGKTAVADWTRGTNDQAFGKKLMGACFNINLLKREPAAFAHARSYARRLIYDTIDFLDDGVINMSTGATAIAKDPVTYKKGATATDPATTASFTYLAGYNRTTGAWNAFERP